MIGIRKELIGGLLLSLTCSFVPFVRAFSYELKTSDMGAYRSDVIRRIFDAVKNSSEYRRTVIDLNIDALGKITSCRIVKSSGSSALDAAMMKALSQVNLEPMKFAISTSDSIQMQICFANAIPDPKNLYLFENESFAYRNLGNSMLNMSGPTALANEQTNGQHSEKAITAGDPQIASVNEVTSADKTYDQEIAKLLLDASAELSFQSIDSSLRNLPESSTLLDQATAFVVKGRALDAAQTYILALIDPIKNGDIESTKMVLEKLSKISPSLRGEDRLNIAMSLLNLYQHMERHYQFSVALLQKANFTSSLESILPIAQQFAEDSSTKNLGRLARYYHYRGDIFQTMRNQGKTKIAYQKYLSVTLENEDAPPEDVELAFEKTLDALQNASDQIGMREVERQQQEWVNKHPEPTNLRAITAACRQLDTERIRFSAGSIYSGQSDEIIERLLKLIRSSSLYTQPISERFLQRSEFVDRLPLENQNNNITRCLQKLVTVNDRLGWITGSSTRSSSLVEQLLRETYKLALKTHYAQQMQAVQRLVEYLIAEDKAQEALVLCDLVGTKPDTEEYQMRPHFFGSVSIEQLRIKALHRLGRDSEAAVLEAKIKADQEKRTQASTQRNIHSAEVRLEKAAPDSVEKIRARTQLGTLLLGLNAKDNIQKVKSNFMESLEELNSGKIKDSSNLFSTFNFELSNQLWVIISKSAEPDVDFATKSIEGLIQLEQKWQRAPGNLNSVPLRTIRTRNTLSTLSTLDNSSFAKNPESYAALMRNLTKFCDEQYEGDDTYKLILLRKLAEFETKSGQNDKSAKTNLEIVNLLERQHEKDSPELVRQLLSLAIAEASAGKVTLARKYQQRASDLEFVSKNPTLMIFSLTNLGDIYAKQGALKEASNTYLQATKQKKDPAHPQNIISAHELVRACEARNNFAVAREFFESAIKFEEQEHATALIPSLYRLELSELLLKEYSAAADRLLRNDLLKQSDDVFKMAADGLISVQGEASSELGTAVQRRALLLTIDGLKEHADNLLEQYKTAAANPSLGSLTLDNNMGSPGPPNRLPGP
jgi:TonB family protein